MAKRKTTPKAPEVEYDIDAIIASMKVGQKRSVLTVKTNHKGVSYHLVVNGKHQKLEDADYQKVMHAPGINELIRLAGKTHGIKPPSTTSVIEYSFRKETQIQMPSNEERG